MWSMCYFPEEIPGGGIGKCQNWKVSESNFCPFWKKLESVRIGK